MPDAKPFSGCYDWTRKPELSLYDYFVKAPKSPEASKSEAPKSSEVPKSSKAPKSFPASMLFEHLHIESQSLKSLGEKVTWVSQLEDTLRENRFLAGLSSSDFFSWVQELDRVERFEDFRAYVVMGYLKESDWIRGSPGLGKLNSVLWDSCRSHQRVTTLELDLDYKGDRLGLQLGFWPAARICADPELWGPKGIVVNPETLLAMGYYATADGGATEADKKTILFVPVGTYPTSCSVLDTLTNLGSPWDRAHLSFGPSMVL